jgi:hypothetical protein
VKTEEGRRTYARTAVRVADAGARAFSTTVAQGGLRFEGEQRNALVRFYALRVDAGALARLNRLLDELDAAAVQSCDEGEEIQITMLLSPMPSKT